MFAADIYRETTRHFLGPVLPLLDDPGVSEILINGPNQIYYEKGGKLFAYDKPGFYTVENMKAIGR